MNFITAPYFSNRNRAASRTTSVFSTFKSLEDIGALLKSNSPIIVNDSFEFSEVARRRARGDMTWIPSENFSMSLLRKAYERAEATELRQIAFKSDNVKRRVWQQALIAGPLVRGTPDYDYLIASDEKLYVQSGRISIDSSPVAGDPEATLQKARRLRNAYMGVPMPQTADHLAAGSAINMGINARKELISEASLPITPSEVMLVSNTDQELIDLDTNAPETDTEMSRTPVSVSTEASQVNVYQRVATNAPERIASQTGLLL